MIVVCGSVIADDSASPDRVEVELTDKEEKPSNTAIPADDADLPQSRMYYYTVLLYQDKLDQYRASIGMSRKLRNGL